MMTAYMPVPVLIIPDGAAGTTLMNTIINNETMQMPSIIRNPFILAVIFVLFSKKRRTKNTI